MLQIAMSKMRSRTKECHLCHVRADILYRYRYDGQKYWLIFYVENVLQRLKLNMVRLIRTVVLGKVRSDEAAT